MKVRNKRLFKRKPLNIYQMVAIGFALIILLGAGLLSLPVASRSGSSMGFRTALFTATSSTCVTGLVLVDTYSGWSGFGQAVILCLIEIGGLGFMSVASFVIFTFKRKMNISTRLMISQSTGTDDAENSVRVQKRIIWWSLLVEGIGAIVLTLRFLKDFSFAVALKLGMFHSVSAYCNAGFDILGFIEPDKSISAYGTDVTVCITIAALIIIGGLGFVVWDELFKEKKPKKWTVYTKLVVITTALLLISGTVLLCLTEWNNNLTIGEMPSLKKILAMFFQSTTTRTAGFAGVDQGSLTDASKAISILLMMIGGSSSSTAGGIKTVTFVVLILFFYSMLKSKKYITVYYRTINSKLVLNALTVFGMFISLSFAGAVFISATSGFGFLDCLYETVSALGTVGLSTGITSKLNVLSQLILIILMFFGRVGILTISLGFLNVKSGENKFKYAETNLLIG